MFWAILTLVISSAFQKDDGLLDLEDSTFTEKLKNKEALILFFDPLCPSSTPAYIEFLHIFKSLNSQSSLVMGKFDMYKNTLIPIALKVYTTPSVVYYKGNDTFVFNQPITNRNLVMLVENLVNPKLKLLYHDKLEEFLRPEIVSFLLVDDKHSPLSRKIAKSVKKRYPANIAHTFDKSISDDLNLQWGRLYALNPFSGIKDSLSEFTFESIHNFIQARDLHKALPLSSCYDYVIEQGLPAVYLFRNESEGESVARLVNETLSKLGDFRVVYGDLHENVIFSRVIGLPAAAQPVAMLIEPVKNNLFKFVHSEKGISKKIVLELIRDWKNGNATRYYKNAPETEGEINGNTFKRIIDDTLSDTLVHFYAPWCEHCREMDENLELVLGNLTNLKVIRVNAEDNEVPEHVIDEYPTVKFYYPVTKRWTSFKGMRKEDSRIKLWERIVEFVKVARKDRRSLKKPEEKRDL